jgi:MFS family permease
MNFIPSSTLTEKQVQSGLKLVTQDGLAVETMVVLTGGTFLTALAIKLGASNFQIGLLAALPTLTNVFQLLALWLVQYYNNRRVITVICTALARFPLVVIGLMPFVFSAGTTIETLIFLLTFHYLFGSLAGATWNSWMKDLLPDNQLGSFFANRTRLTQILNVVLSLAASLLIDHVKTNYPGYETTLYTLLFLAGSVAGLISLVTLIRTPEPVAHIHPQNVIKLFREPLMDKNYRRMLLFNACWIFSVNLATPFLSVYMLKTIGLSLFCITTLAVVGQVSGIIFVRIWGRYADKYSNKTVIGICAPVYIGCILAWAFTAASASIHFNLILLVLINIFSGLSIAGVNLSLNNIGIKLAPKDRAMAYLSAKNMIIACASAGSPLIGGLMADFFVTHQRIPNIHLHPWNIFFVISAMLAILSVRLLKYVKEPGEGKKEVVLGEMLPELKLRVFRFPATVLRKVKRLP